MVSLQRSWNLPYVWLTFSSKSTHKLQVNWGLDHTTPLPPIPTSLPLEVDGLSDTATDVC